MKSIAKFSSKELNQLFGSNISFINCLSINTDSRDISDNEIFIPIVGDNFDGHDFINNLNNICFCQNDKYHKVNNEKKDKIILVENTIDAYNKLANYYRKKINPRVIAITGSSGKTTVKEITHFVFLEKYKTHKTEFNFNNDIGVPKTILEMPEDTEVLILEMGMRGLNEIKYLSKTAEPDIAIITNIGTAHIGRLGSVENITKAKSEILDYLNINGLAILPENNYLINKAKELEIKKIKVFNINEISNIRFINNKTSFVFNKQSYSINAIGYIFPIAAIPVIIAAHYMNICDEFINNGLNKFFVPNGRGNVKFLDKIIIVDESYNANPDSLKSAINNLINCFPVQYKKVLVLGELAELGDFENTELEEVANQIKNSLLDKIILVGNINKIIKDLLKDKAILVTNIEDCCKILNEIRNENNEKTVITVKGSRIAELDKVVLYLKEKNNGKN